MEVYKTLGQPNLEIFYILDIIGKEMKELFIASLLIVGLSACSGSSSDGNKSREDIILRMTPKIIQDEQPSLVTITAEESQEVVVNTMILGSVDFLKSEGDLIADFQFIPEKSEYIVIKMSSTSKSIGANISKNLGINEEESDLPSASVSTKSNHLLDLMWVEAGHEYTLFIWGVDIGDSGSYELTLTQLNREVIELQENEVLAYGFEKDNYKCTDLETQEIIQGVEQFYSATIYNTVDHYYQPLSRAYKQEINVLSPLTYKTDEKGLIRPHATLDLNYNYTINEDGQSYTGTGTWTSYRTNRTCTGSSVIENEILI